VLDDLDTRRLLVRERSEQLAHEMRTSKPRDRALEAPRASKLLVAAGRLVLRPRLTH